MSDYDFARVFLGLAVTAEITWRLAGAAHWPAWAQWLGAIAHLLLLARILEDRLALARTQLLVVGRD